MKKWQLRFMQIAESLGLTEKAKSGQLSAEDQTAIFSAYEKEHGISFEADKAKNEEATTQVTLSAEEQQAIAQALNIEQAAAPATAQAAIEPLMTVIAGLRADVAKLSVTPEGQPQPQQAAEKVNVFGANHTAAYLFGIESKLYATEKWYNKLMLTRKAGDEMSETEQEILMNDFKEFSAQAQRRFVQLVQSGNINLLNYNAIVSGNSSLNYDALESVAGEYVTRRTDAIFAYIKSLPSVTNIFPRVSNIQNKQVAPAVAFGELSQGYRKGAIYKGQVSFDADVYEVSDLMFKFDFSDMVELEKQYIGYLNREGSDVIKWTFLEWIIVHFGEQLIVEQNRRNVYGYRVPQQAVTSNPAMTSADGAYAAIMKAEESFKILPFAEIGTYSESDMLSVVEAFVDKLHEVLPSTDNIKILLNARHQRWYIRAYREKYGQDNDFGGNVTGLIDINPSTIVWVPNMPINSYKIVAMYDGGVELLEDKAGEMLNFYFHRELEGVVALSRWKEGASATYAGKRFGNKADLEADNFAHQRIFTNLATTEKATAEEFSVADNDQIVITGNTAITTVTGYEVGRVYKLIAKAAGVSVAASGAFSKLASAFTAGAAGDYIKVYAELTDRNGVTVATGKFLELERSVTA